jgi:hypothetical protein
MREALDVRDSLCLQLVLGNAKRGGDITHICAEDITYLKSYRHLSRVTISFVSTVITGLPFTKKG